MSGKSIFGIGAVAIFAIFCITLIFGSWYTVMTGYTGIVYRNGKIIEATEPGLHFKTPWIESVEVVKNRTMSITFDDVSAYTSDQQTSHSKITVIWHLDTSKIINLVSTAGTEYWTQLIVPVVPTYYKSIINANDAAHIITGRERISNEVVKFLTPVLAARGIILENVQLQNIDFTKEYEKAVESAVQARALVTKAEQDLARKKIEADQIVAEKKGEADFAIETARGAAESIRINAIAQAESIRIRGIAEASSITARGEALAKNPGLVALSSIERWNGQLPTSMIPGSSIPFINVK